jgi:phasin family protein
MTVKTPVPPARKAAPSRAATIAAPAPLAVAPVPKAAPMPPAPKPVAPAAAVSAADAAKPTTHPGTDPGTHSGTTPTVSATAPVPADAVPAPIAAKATVTKVTYGLAGAVAGLEKSQAEVTAKMDKITKTAEEFVSFGQGNVEAMMKSSQIWAAGIQDLGKQFAATAQAQFDETVSVFKAMSGVKSIKEAIDLQSTLARSSMEKAVAETSKITDASMKLAEQAIAPITARMTLAVEKFSRAG